MFHQTIQLDHVDNNLVPIMTDFHEIRFPA